MATIWKRKDRDVWVVDFRDASGRRFRLSVPTRDEAEDLLAEKIKERKHAPLTPHDRTLTLADYTARWLQAARSQLAPITVQNYTQHLTVHILPRLGRIRVADLRRRHVKDFLTTLCSTTNAHGRPFAKNSLRLIKAALSTVLTDAVDDELLFANPVMQLGRSKKHSATRMTTDELITRVRPMTWAQAQTVSQMLTTLDREHLLDVRYTMLLTLLLKTGMRPSEALALQRGDLDLSQRTVRVERAATIGGQVKSTKTRDVRTVDLSASLLPTLTAYQHWLEVESMSGRWGESPWLFPNDQGTLLDERHMRRVFHRVLRRAGLPTFRLYDLRHTFASLLLSSAVPLLYVSHQLGHTNPTTTLKYYARWIPSGDRRYVDVLDRASGASWHQPLAPGGHPPASASESAEFPRGLSATPSPPTHDDESTTTHPRCARRDSWLTPSPAAVRQIDWW